MRTAMALTGYIPEALAARLAQDGRRTGRVEVRPEKDVNDVLARVSAADISEVRTGASEGGLVLVQLILKEGATVETIVRTVANPAGLTAFYDPVLNRVRQEATAKTILI